MARSTKKHSKAPLIIMLIGFAVGFLFGRGLEWNYGDDDDDDYEDMF